jgi:hypothetical protein
MKEKNILYNAIRCPDGTLLVSVYRHDYKQHIQADGRLYSIDGGDAYQRIGAADKEFENLIVYDTDPFEKIREFFFWTSRLDSEGKLLPTPIRRKLKDLTDEHILALVEYTESGYPVYINDIFKKEVEYRGLNYVPSSE